MNLKNFVQNEIATFLTYNISNLRTTLVKVKNFITYHVSLAFLVSGQAQQGFNFFFSSVFASTFAAVLPIFINGKNKIRRNLAIPCDPNQSQWRNAT